MSPLIVVPFNRHAPVRTDLTLSESARGDEYIRSRTWDRQECLPHQRMPHRGECRLENLHHNECGCAACAGLEACTTMRADRNVCPT